MSIKQPLTSKRLFKDLFRGKQLEYIPFLPYNFSLACRLEQVAPEEFQSDPGLMANALLNAGKILGFDVILTKVELELPGQTSNIETSVNKIKDNTKTSVCFEAMRRIKQTMDKKVTLACQISGPLSLTRAIWNQGEDRTGDVNPGRAEMARQAVLQIIKTIGEIGPDMILVSEEDLNPDTLGGTEEITAFLEPLWNSIRYYNSEPLLVTHSIDNEILNLICHDISGVIFPNGIDRKPEELALLNEATGTCFSFPIPKEVFAGQYQLLDGFLAGIKQHFGNKGIFTCSAGEIPPSIDVEDMKTILGLLKGF